MDESVIIPQARGLSSRLTTSITSSHNRLHVSTYALTPCAGKLHIALIVFTMAISEYQYAQPGAHRSVQKAPNVLEGGAGPDNAGSLADRARFRGLDA